MTVEERRKFSTTSPYAERLLKMVPTDSVEAPALALGAGASAGVAWLLPAERLRRSSVMCATRAAQRSAGDAALFMPVTLVIEL